MTHNFAKNLFDTINWRMRNLNLYVDIFYFVNEGTEKNKELEKIEGINYKLFSKENYQDLERLSIPEDRNHLIANIKWENDYILCAIYKNTEIVGFIHGVEKFYYFLGKKHLLEKSQLYINHIYVQPEFRRNKISYNLRVLFYEQLSSQGIDEFYSHINAFNTAGIKSAKKSGSNFLSKQLFIRFGGRPAKYITIKRK